MPQSYVTVRRGDPVLMLPLGVSVESVALECKSAAIAFLRGSGWGKRELAGWLVGRYRPLCTLVRVDEPPPSSPPPSSRVDSTGLPSVIRDARSHLLGQIRAAIAADVLWDVEHVHGTGPATIEERDVLRVEDHFGALGWVPVDRPRMRLTERVGSLVMAHRLTAGDAFADAWAGLEDLLEEVTVDELWNATA